MWVVPSSSSCSCSSIGKQSQLLLKPTEVELGLQVGVEFDNIDLLGQYCWVRLAGLGLPNPIFAALGLFEGEETCKVGFAGSTCSIMFVGLGLLVRVCWEGERLAGLV